jgi:serine/threonine-protein kinase RIO1
LFRRPNTPNSDPISVPAKLFSSATQTAPEAVPAQRFMRSIGRRECDLIEHCSLVHARLSEFRSFVYELTEFYGIDVLETLRVETRIISHDLQRRPEE